MDAKIPQYGPPVEGALTTVQWDREFASRMGRQRKACTLSSLTQQLVELCHYVL